MSSPATPLFAGKVRVRASALITQQNRIVLVQQNSPTRPQPIWLLPGGGIEPGEASKQALVREVMEETNLTVQKAELKYVHEFIEPPYHAVELYFFATEYSGNLVTGSDPELDQNKQQIMKTSWVSLENIDQVDLYPEFLKSELKTGAYKTPEIHHFKTGLG